MTNVYRVFAPIREKAALAVFCGARNHSGNSVE